MEPENRGQLSAKGPSQVLWIHETWEGLGSYFILFWEWWRWMLLTSTSMFGGCYQLCFGDHVLQRTDPGLLPSEAACDQLNPLLLFELKREPVGVFHADSLFYFPQISSAFSTDFPDTSLKLYLAN